MALAFVVTMAVAVGIGLMFGSPWIWYAVIVGLPLAALAATIVMSRRAERAAYGRLAGQPGAAGAALTSLRGGWFTSAEPVAVEGARSGSFADAALGAVAARAQGPVARAGDLGRRRRVAAGPAHPPHRPSGAATRPGGDRLRRVGGMDDDR